MNNFPAELDIIHWALDKYFYKAKKRRGCAFDTPPPIIFIITLLRT